MVFIYVPKFQRTQVKFSPRLSHGAHCTLKAGIRLVSRYLTLQVFSQVAGCQPSLFASIHLLSSIETPCSLGFWRVDGKYLSADLGLRCWLGGAEVVLSKSFRRFLAPVVGEAFFFYFRILFISTADSY